MKSSHLPDLTVWWRLLTVFVLGLLGWSSRAAAAPILRIEPITWNVIGLDSNNVNAGPNLFPVGARVCNVGDMPATGVTARFFFDGGMTNPYLSLQGLNTITLDTLPAGGTPPQLDSSEAGQLPGCLFQRGRGPQPERLLRPRV